MDHEAYEKEMIDSVNRNAEGKAKLVTKADKAMLKAGFGCVLVSLFTAGLAFLSVWCLIRVVKAPGYLAVLLFLASIFVGIVSLTLLYALGIAVTKATGEVK